MQMKMIFPLAQDADGYPPVSAESVWVQEEVDGRFIIENVPFFAKEATIGDVVEAHIEDGVLIYKSTVRRSGNSLVRVIVFEGTNVGDVSTRFERMGCQTEIYAALGLVSVSIPPEVMLSDVQAVLRAGFEAGNWDYEEPLLRQ